MIKIEKLQRREKGKIKNVEITLYGPLARDCQIKHLITHVAQAKDLCFVRILSNLELNCLGTIKVKYENIIYIWTDHICSVPLLYNVQTCEVTHNLKHDIEYEICQEQFNIFKSSGFTEPGKTIYSLWQRTEAQCVYKINDKISKYPRVQSHKMGATDLSNIVSNIFDEIVRRSHGRKIWIPLSGGYDSIFILMEISKRTEKFACFTYGPTGNKEVENAQAAVNFTNADWQKINLSHAEFSIYSGWPRIKSYLMDNFNGYTTPPINDVYHIEELMKRKIIIEGDIIINGQSGDFATGGHDYAERESSISEYMAKHHVITKNNNPKYTLDILKSIKNDVTYQKIKDVLYQKEKYWRQSSLVVQGQLAYSHNNLNWELPLWDKRFVEYFENLDNSERLDQKHYKDYLARAYSQIFANFAQKRTTNFLGITGLFLRILVKIARLIKLKTEIFYKLGAFTGHYSDHLKILGLKRYVSRFKRSWLPAGRIILFISNDIILNEVQKND